MKRKAIFKVPKKTNAQLWLDNNMGPVEQGYKQEDPDRADRDMTKTYLQCSYEEKLNGTIFYLN